MKKTILFFSCCLLAASLFAQDSLNIKMLSNWDDESLPDGTYSGTPFSYAGCYGYAANGREYAMLGSSGYIHVFDVTDPATPVEIDRFQGGQVTVWREMHVYHDRLYSISDATNEGMMIFDLSQLPDTVIKTNQTTEFFNKGHTLFVDQATGRLYVLGANQGIVVLDLTQDPDHPTLLAKVNLTPGGYIHDMYVNNNIGFASHGYGGLIMWDFTDPTMPQAIASYNTNGYCHSNWRTEDGKYLLVADEVPRGLPLLMLDLSQVATSQEIKMVKSFRAPLTDVAPTDESVTYHNPYILGNEAYLAAYMDGLVIFDISDPANPVRKAYYDTFENTAYDAYNGCWGAYPFLPSGNIIVSDIQRGLFMLQRTDLTATETPQAKPLNVAIFPNPVVEKAVVQLNLEEPSSYRLVSANGALVKSGKFGYKLSMLDMSGMSAGIYYLTITVKSGQQVTKKVVKQ